METQSEGSRPPEGKNPSKLRVRRTNIRKVRKRKTEIPWFSIGLLLALLGTGLGLLIFALFY